MDFVFKTCVILSALTLSCCNGQDVGGSEVSFTVQIIPDAANQMFQLDKTRVLVCRVSATEDSQRWPTLSWEINDVLITSTTGRVRVDLREGNSLILRIDNVQVSDEGIYRCVATLGSQTDSRSTKVQVIQDLVVLSNSYQFGMFGEDGEVKCETVARPPASLTWKEENGTKIENSTKCIILPDRLLIKNLDDDDSKTYYCDIVVVETGESVLLSIIFEVFHRPKIEMIPISPRNPKEGDAEVKITCQATGIPKPTYQFKKGEIIQEYGVDKVNGILILRNVMWEDEGNYTCVATNRAGSDQKSIWLDVITAADTDTDDGSASLTVNVTGMFLLLILAYLSAPW